MSLAQYTEITKAGTTYMVPSLLAPIIDKAKVWELLKESGDQHLVKLIANMHDSIIYDINLDIINSIEGVEWAQWNDLNMGQIILDGGHTGGYIIMEIWLKVSQFKLQTRLEQSLQIKFNNGKEDQQEGTSTKEEGGQGSQRS